MLHLVGKLGSQWRAMNKIVDNFDFIVKGHYEYYVEKSQRGPDRSR